MTTSDDKLEAAGWVPVLGLWLPPRQPGMLGWTDWTAYTTDDALAILDATTFEELRP